MSPARVPLNIGTTRGVHFRRLLGALFVKWAVAATIVFAIGATRQGVAIMVAGPLVLALGFLAYGWSRASKDAASEFFDRFAAAHELNHWPQWSLNEYTPLLSGGDRRHCDHWMESGGRGVGWYTFEVRHDNGEKSDAWESHDFTLATVELGEHGMQHFQGIYLRRRRGIVDRLDGDANWLRDHSLEKVELESTKFMQEYELWVDAAQDDLVVRQLFAPSFVVWLAEHPLRPGFELRAGELVVFIPGHCGEAGKLEFLLMAAAEISRRIQAELTEAAQAGSL